MRKLLAPFLLLILAGALLLSFGEKGHAPQVVFTTIDGQQVSMEELRGKVVLVNFWATTCPGCIEEMPRLVETYKRYHDKGFELVAVAMEYDPPSQVANFARNNKLPFMIALDPQGDVATAFNEVKLTPTAFVIDRDGKIVRNVVGTLDFAALHRYLDEQLGGKG